MASGSRIKSPLWCWLHLWAYKRKGWPVLGWTLDSTLWASKDKMVWDQESPLGILRHYHRGSSSTSGRDSGLRPLVSTSKLHLWACLQSQHVRASELSSKMDLWASSGFPLGWTSAEQHLPTSRPHHTPRPAPAPGPRIADGLTCVPSPLFTDFGRFLSAGGCTRSGFTRFFSTY